MNFLLLKLHFGAQNEAEALLVAKSLADRVHQCLGAPEAVSTRSYWKTAGQWETAFRFRASSTTPPSLDEWVGSLGGGWVVRARDSEEPWAVWSGSDGATSTLDPRVTWGCLERVVSGESA